MKKFLLIFLLIVLLVIGGLVAMFMASFNPTAFQNEVVSSLQKLSGRDVSVKGETVVSWTPMPTVQITDVRIGNMDKSQNPNMLTIEKIKISIEWSSLLKSPLVIKSVELTKPVLLLERLESNRANFVLPFLSDPKFQLKEAELISGGQSNTTKIDQIVLKDAVIRYDNQVTGNAFDITGINGQMILDSIRGPFRFDGNAGVGNKIYGLSLKTGNFQDKTSVDVALELKEETSGAQFKLNGKMTPALRDKWLNVSGNFSIEHFGAFADGLGIFVPNILTSQKASGSLSVEINPNADILKNVIVQFGEGENATALAGTFTRHTLGKNTSYEVDIGIDNFNPDEWKDMLSKFNWNLLTGEKEYPEIALKTKIKSIPYSGGLLSDLTLNANYRNNILSISDSAVVLPGDTKAAFSGSAKMVQGVPLFDLNFDLKTQSGNAFVNWLFPKTADFIQTQALQQGMVKGRLAIEPDTVSVSLSELKFNNSDTTGVVQYTKEKGYTLNLNLNNVNFDTYTGWKNPEKAIELSEIPQLIKKYFEQATWMNDTRLQGKINVRDATVFGIAIPQANLEGQLSDNILRIDTLKIKNAAASDAEIKAVLNGVGRSQMNVEGLHFNLVTKQFPLLLEKMRTQATLPLLTKASDVSVGFVLNGGRDGKWQFDTQMALSDANIKLTGTVMSLETNPVFQDMSFDIAHPKFRTFIDLVAPGFDVFPKLDGSFKAKGVFSGTKNRFSLEDTRVGIGLQQLNGSLSFDGQKIKTLSLDVSSPSIDVERFTNDINPFYTSTSGLSQKVFDFSKWDNWAVDGKLKASQLLYGNVNIRQADISFNLQNKEFILTKFSGNTVNGDNSPFEINGRLDWNTTPKLSFNFDVQKMPIRSDFMVFSDFAFGGGFCTVKGNFDTRGVSPAEFAQQLNGQGTISIQGGQMMGVNVEGMIPIITRAVQRNEGPKVFEPEFNRVLNNGKTIMKTLSGDFTISNGIVRMMDLTMKTSNATANPTQIIWDLPKRTLDISIPVVLDPLNTLPPFVLGISVTGSRAAYKPNYADLSAVLSSQSQTALANDLRRKEEAAQAEIAQKRSDRISQSRELTIDARNALALMEQKIQEYPFEKGKRILQSARDAMALVNQLAVREEPTDAQLIQQIEQARIVLLKAEEFQTSLEQETLFNIQKQMENQRLKSEQMTAQLMAWAEGYPDIVLLGKLAENAKKNNEIVQQLASTLKPDSDKETVEQILNATDDAVEKITKAYQHASRFDLSRVAKTEIDGVSDTDQQIGTEQKTVKGSFKRSN